MKQKKGLIIAAALVLLAVLTFVIRNAVLDRQVIFDGSRTRNPDRYAISFTRMNQTDTANLILKAGEELSVTYDIRKGNIDLSIAMEGESPVYTGSRLDRAAFTVGIPKDGTYVITITAKQAAGDLLIEVKR